MRRIVVLLYLGSVIFTGFRCLSTVEIQTPNLTKPLSAGAPQCPGKAQQKIITLREIQIATPMLSRDFRSGTPAEAELSLIKEDPTDAQRSSIPEIDFSSHGGNYLLLGYSSTHMHFHVENCEQPAVPPAKRGRK